MFCKTPFPTLHLYELLSEALQLFADIMVGVNTFVGRLEFLAKLIALLTQLNISLKTRIDFFYELSAFGLKLFFPATIKANVDLLIQIVQLTLKLFLHEFYLKTKILFFSQPALKAK